MSVTTCVFDAYGTLFDVAAAARQVALEPDFSNLGTDWAHLSADWRMKQLQYSWLRAITGDHTDFWQVTQHALDWALEAQGLTESTTLRTRLLELYWELKAYAEVPQMLATLKEQGLATAILSNGSPEMLDGAVRSADIATLLDQVISVEEVGIYKPAATVYDLVSQHMNCRRDEVLFVSSNGWDVASAAAYGFQTVWVNRAGEPVDRLNGQPDTILTDLTDIPTLTAS